MQLGNLKELQIKISSSLILQFLDLLIQILKKVARWLLLRLGKSFKGAFEGDMKSKRKSVYYHYYEYPIWHKVQPHYGIKTDRYKLMHFYYTMDEWELYDLETDPNEMNNIYAQASPELIDNLKKELQQLRTEYKDDGSIEQMKRMTDTVITRVYNEPKIYKESNKNKK